jgi:hypothetical protein
MVGVLKDVSLQADVGEVVAVLAQRACAPRGRPGGPAGPQLLLVDDPTMSLGLEETDDATPLLNSLAKERGLGVLICIADAKATAWSKRAPQSPIQPASSIASTLA